MRTTPTTQTTDSQKKYYAAPILYSEWRKSVKSCTLCNISHLCGHKVLPRLVNCVGKDPTLLVIGEAPGQVEYAQKEPFIGPSGIVLREILYEALPESTPYIITNAIQCTPFTDEYRGDIRKPSQQEIKECSRYIKQLYTIFPITKTICAGKVAEDTITRLNITDFITILHPSRIMQSKRYDYDFSKAAIAIKQYME